MAEAEESNDDLEEKSTPRTTRECPIPRPAGLVGEILGFKNTAGKESSSDGKGTRPP